jgi:hypothetical protein
VRSDRAAKLPPTLQRANASPSIQAPPLRRPSAEASCNSAIGLPASALRNFAASIPKIAPKVRHIDLPGDERQCRAETLLTPGDDCDLKELRVPTVLVPAIEVMGIGPRDNPRSRRTSGRLVRGSGAQGGQ